MCTLHNLRMGVTVFAIYVANSVVDHIGGASERHALWFTRTGVIIANDASRSFQIAIYHGCCIRSDFIWKPKQTSNKSNQ